MSSGSRPTRGFLVGSLAMLVLLAGAGCRLPGVIGLIELRIDPTPAAKGISVGDLEVTGLEIQVRDPEGEVLKSIDWQTAYGAQCYLIPAREAGEHEIEVTHFGKRDGVAVEAVDTAVLDVRKREVTLIEVVPGCIGVVRIES